MTVKDVRESESYKARAADRQSLEELGHQIVELAGHMNAANYRFLSATRTNEGFFILEISEFGVA